MNVSCNTLGVVFMVIFVGFTIWLVLKKPPFDDDLHDGGIHP